MARTSPDKTFRQNQRIGQWNMLTPLILLSLCLSCTIPPQKPVVTPRKTAPIKKESAQPVDLSATADLNELLAVATGAYEIPKIMCNRVTGIMTIDGKLDEPAWQKASTITFVEVVTGWAPLCGKTTGLLMWDDKYLYIGLRAEDRNIWAAMTEHDDTLCQEEVVEVFVDPDGDGKSYIEIEINPRNAVFDLQYLPNSSEKKRGDKNWNCPGLKHAVAVNGTLNNSDDMDQDWVVEIALPWEAFKCLKEKINLPPNHGDTWRINLYRYERPNGPTGIVEHTAWSPTKQVNFHLPARFGKLTFSR